MNESDEITQFLAHLSGEKCSARNRVVALIYSELRRVAAAQLRAERQNHTLQPTALAHEACIRLLQSPGPWKNREHFFRTAAKVMRQVLIDYARSKRAIKRGRDHAVTSFSEARKVPDYLTALSVEDLLALDGAVDKLKSKDPRQALIVELRFYVGLSEDEVAEALDISARTVKRDWEMARAWLFGQLKSRQEDATLCSQHHTALLPPKAFPGAGRN